MLLEKLPEFCGDGADAGDAMGAHDTSVPSLILGQLRWWVHKPWCLVAADPCTVTGALMRNRAVGLRTLFAQQFAKQAARLRMSSAMFGAHLAICINDLQLCVLLQASTVGNLLCTLGHACAAVARVLFRLEAIVDTGGLIDKVLEVLPVCPQQVCERCRTFGQAPL